MDTSEVIRSFTGDYAFLSNFYVEKSGTTVEHRFQAAKAKNDPALRDEILAAPTPGKAKRLGRAVSLSLNWWHGVRMEVMENALREKFSDPTLRRWLIDTKDAFLIEGNQWHDQFWGTCHCKVHKDRPGYNYLGQLLMKLRAEYIMEDNVREIDGAQMAHDAMEDEYLEEMERAEQESGYRAGKGEL